MGIAAALSGGIIMMMAVIVFGISLPTMVSANEKLNRISRDEMDMHDSIEKTSIAISSIQANLVSNTIQLTVQNTGLTKLYDYSKFTILVTYNGSSSNNILNGNAVTQVTEQFTYAGISSNTPSNGHWVISTFVNDAVDPQILNPGESMQITCKPSEFIQQGNIIAIVSTDNGVISTSSIGVV